MPIRADGLAEDCGVEKSHRKFPKQKNGEKSVKNMQKQYAKAVKKHLTDRSVCAIVLKTAEDSRCRKA